MIMLRYFLYAFVCSLVFSSNIVNATVLHTSEKPLDKVKLVVEDLSQDEMTLMIRIKKLYPDFNYSKSANVTYFKSSKHTNYVPLKKTLIFDKLPDGVIAYNVEIDLITKNITYYFNEGSSFYGNVTLIPVGKDLYKTEKVCGRSGCDVYFYKNQKELKTNSKASSS
jgi:hypothetical protein